MSTLVIEGGRRIEGRVDVEGNKNAALPLLAACLLTDEWCTLTNMPRIADVEVMARLLLDLGAEVEGIGSTTLRIRCANVTKDEPDSTLVGRLRGSVLLLGPLLARRGRAVVAPPGGDFPARRSIKTHLEALIAMGARVLPGSGHRLEVAGRPEAGFDLSRRGVGDRAPRRRCWPRRRRRACRRFAMPPASRTSSSCASSCARWAPA